MENKIRLSPKRILNKEFSIEQLKKFRKLSLGFIIGISIVWIIGLEMKIGFGIRIFNDITICLI